MANSVVTNVAKEKLVKVRAGIINVLPKVTGVAFGCGAVTDIGIRTPLSTDLELQEEVLRQIIDGYDLQADEMSVLYSCTLAKDALVNVRINEIALYDAEGDLVAIKSFSNKGKDDDMEMVFEILDQF